MKHPVVSRCRFLLLLVAALPPAIRAQVATDGSFGKPAGQLPGPAFAIPDSLGKKVGATLFHSFSEFSLDQTQSATFSGPAEVKNILARVTGGNISTIDGMLKSDIAGANFFLLNPKGVIFGPNASVDVSGSFAVSTGDRITLEDGAHFKARASDPSDALLTSAAPAAFGFLGKKAGPITFDGSKLPGPPDPQTGVSATGGKWSLAGGDIQMKNGAALNATGVVIRGGRLTIEGSKIQVAASRPGDGADVRVRGALTLRDVSSINASASGGGDLHLSADSISISGLGSGISATSSGTGAASIHLDVTGELNIQTGSLIQTVAGEVGTGGSIFVKAGKVAIIDQGAPQTGIAADTFSDASAGNVQLDIAGSLSISGGGKISSDTFGGGAGGNIGIAARSVSIAGEGLPSFTAISTESQPGLNGRSGNIVLRVRDALKITGGGLITAATFSPGAGGSIDITAGSVRISGKGASRLTGINAGTRDPQSGGPGGDLRLSIAGPLVLTDSGQIIVNTFGSGRSGNAEITASSISLTGERTSISAESTLGINGGAGGNILIRADSIKARAGASISASTAGSGAGGALDIVAKSIALDGARITSDTAGPEQVPVPRKVSDLEIAFTIDLPQAQNLTLGLVHQLMFIPLLSGVGGTAQRFENTTLADNAKTPIENGTAPFTGRFKPQGLLGAFDGTLFEGEWLLFIGGSDPAETITVQNWSLSTGGFTRSSTDVPKAVVATDLFPFSMLTVENIPPERFVPIIPGRGGDVHVIADMVTLANGARISAQTSNSSRGGDVRITAGEILVSTKGRISAATSGSGAGGNIEFSAANLALSTRGAISAKSTGAGAGGSIRGAVHGALQITRKGRVTASTSLSGPGGNISLDAGDLFISTGGKISAATAGTGAGGNIEFSADNLALSTGGAISAQSAGTGKGGGIRGTVPGTLQITDSGLITASTLLSGRGGNVSLDAGDLLVSGEGQISAATSGSGAGGNIEFSAANLSLAGRGSISAQSTGTGRGGGIRGMVPGTLQITDSGLITASTLLSGKGGNVSLDAGDLFISTGGKISAATEGTGKGGTIDVNAERIVILTGNSSDAALISAESTNEGDGGRGGDISVSAGSLRIDGAPDFLTGISARSFGAGDSGSVRLQLGTLSLDSSAFIGSSNTGAGRAGTVMVRADGDIFMRGGSVISTSAFQANAGDIDIASRTRIDLREGAAITASAGLNGGNITIAAPDFIHLIDSSIAATAGTTQAATGGMGGNITIDPEFMVLDHSFIKADAAIGQGGNILLQTDNFLSSETSITATGTTAGTVEIVAPELDLSAALVILRGGLVDPSTQLREQCARRLGLDFSSFLVIGRGGVSLAPDDPLTETGPARKRQPAR